MTSVGAKLLVLLFTGLVIACALDEPRPLHFATSSSPVDSNLCGVLSSSIAGNTPSAQLESLFLSKETLAPVPKIYPLGSLARTIDHPPEKTA